MLSDYRIVKDADGFTLERWHGSQWWWVMTSSTYANCHAYMMAEIDTTSILSLRW